MPSRRQPAPTLRVCSVNLRGLTARGRLHAAAARWRSGRYSIVLIQEHHLTSHLHNRATLQALASLGWRVFIAFGRPGPSGRPRGGTAVLIRRSLITSGDITEPTCQTCPRGRHTAVSFRWSGHRLHVCSVYLPNQAPARVAYIHSTLAPLAAAAAAKSQQLLWGGDFNFTPDPHLDRRSLARTPLRRSTHHSDVASQSAFDLLLPQLVDIWRHRHPSRRAFTYTNGSVFGRLDRIYVSASLLPHTTAATVSTAPIADHCPVAATVVGTLPPSIGQQRRRLRLGFLGTPALAQQLSAWIEEQAHHAPTDHHALLIWWPGFKRRIYSVCRTLQRASYQSGASETAARAALDALAARWEAGDDSTLPSLVTAHAAWREAAHAAGAEAAAQLRRHSWLHSRERPSPTLSRRLRLARQATAVAALRGESGALLTGPAAARRAATHAAGVSARPTTDATAQQQVLAALAAGRHLPPHLASALASTSVTEQEVRRALRRGQPGKAPGLDGIPSDLYRSCRDAFAPLLARLFTAVATTGDLPPGFHDGLITILFKSGDRTNPADYRPITLLSTDYRLYALILARRLGPSLPHIIDPEQTAFVPGRLVGDNVMALQLLPYLLRRQGRWALAVCCDFRKAFDTCDRSFLFAAMRAVGVGEGFIALVRPLLCDTSASAIVSGYISAAAPFEAGVRQGCPLSPLLYLFIAQALTAFLRSRGIGIEGLLPGHPITTTTGTYADDAQVLLGSPAQITPFLAAMDTFGDATGQRLNHTKSKLLPIGAVPTHFEAMLPPPTARRGLVLVDHITALGIPIANGDPPAEATAAVWRDLLSRVEAVYAKISTLGLSTFGRGFASAGYGVSKLLYHAEFLGHPPPAVADRLTRITARLVDRDLSPSAGGRHFAGLHRNVLFGHPQLGGFGALPWLLHITARHLRWAARLLASPIIDAAPAEPQLSSQQSGASRSPTHLPPWVAIATALLDDLPPSGLLVWQVGQPPPGSTSLLPPPLLRLHAALASMPPIADVGSTALEPGPWCHSMPLWGNPLLPTGLDTTFADFVAAGVTTLGQLLAIHNATVAAPTQDTYTTSVRHPLLRGSYAFAERHVALERQTLLLANLPPAWVDAARVAAAAGHPALASPAEVLATAVLPRIGWRRADGQPLPLASISVKAATTILTIPASDWRANTYLRPFAAAAVGAADLEAAPLPELRAALQRLWQLPWENGRKETFWRLVYDALPTAARLHRDESCSCGTSGVRPDRLHHFWDCPAARAVVADITSSLAAAAPRPPPALTTADLWLARTPPGIHAGVWGVVCLAAVEAMDRGRRRLVATRLQQQQQQPPAAGPQYRQLTLDGFLLPGTDNADPAVPGEGPPPPPTHDQPQLPPSQHDDDPATAASRTARRAFWSLLADFTALGRAPQSWLAELSPTHPFLLVADGRLRPRPAPVLD